MKDIIIYGAGAHANVVADIINSSYTDFNILTKITDATFHQLEEYKSSSLYIIIAIGDNYRREKICHKIKKHYPHIKFPKLIHKSVIINSNVTIQDGTVIASGVILNTNCCIGKQCIINTGSIVEHDCQIANFTNLATGVKMAGTVNVGPSCFIGIGSIILHKIEIAGYNVIGAGSLVTKNIIQTKAVFYGHPCKFVRYRNIDDPYL